MSTCAQSRVYMKEKKKPSEYCDILDNVCLPFGCTFYLVEPVIWSAGRLRAMITVTSEP